MGNHDEDDPHSKLRKELFNAYDVIDELSALNEERQIALSSAFRIIMRLMQLADVSTGVTFTDVELAEVDTTHTLSMLPMLEETRPQLTLILREKQKQGRVIEFVNAENTEVAKKLPLKSQLN